MTKAEGAGTGSPPASIHLNLEVNPIDVARVIELVRRNPAEGMTLEQPLLEAAQAIFDADCEALRVPTRSELADKLTKLRNAAEAVRELVQDPSILAVDPNIHETFGVPEGLDVPLAMARLIRATEKHIDRLDGMAGQKGPTTAAEMFGRQSARLLCATVVVAAWRQQRGRPPAPTTQRAQEACAELWKAAGGRQSDAVKRGDVLGGAAWERHLKNARNLDPDQTGDAIVLQRAADIFAPRTRTVGKI